MQELKPGTSTDTHPKYEFKVMHGLIVTSVLAPCKMHPSVVQLMNNSLSLGSSINQN